MKTSSDQFIIDGLLNLKSPSDVQLSPDGCYVVFALSDSGKVAKDTPCKKTLYFVDVKTAALHPLTGSHSVTNDSPCWSPDSQSLAFVSNRSNPEEMQLYTLDLMAGEAQARTDLRGSITVPRWAPDGKAIAFLYSGSVEKQAALEPDPIVFDEITHFNRIWLWEKSTDKLRAISPDTCHIFEYAWSPDGSKFAVVAASHPNPAEGWYGAQIFTVDANSGLMQQICETQHQVGRLTWAPDGASVAFVSGVMSDEGSVSGDVYVVPGNGGLARCVTPDIDHSITWIEWRDPGILYGGRYVEGTILGWIDPQNGDLREVLRGSYAINGLGPQEVSAAQNNTFAAIRESFSEPPDIYLGSLEDGSWRQLTHLPLDQAVFPPMRVENKHWNSLDGMPVHGFLVYPSDYQPGKRYPLFLNVHGGPSWSYVPRYVYHWARLLAARGCFILMPNPRGSWGRGHKYQSANVGDLGGGDWQDANAGVDCLIEDGLVDPDRLAVGGWSYGGYLTTWAVTQTTRFRCAVAGASITNYESNYGVVSNREWQTTMFGSYVYDQPDLHRSRSPLTHVRQVKTPTLLVHGERDMLAPPEQAIEFYTALRHFGVPTQLVIYPREPHGFAEQSHQRDFYQRFGEWIDRYLFT